jgi:maleate isomerase
MDNNVRRFGALIPPGNVAIERELPPLLPPGVVMNVNRLSRPGKGVRKAESLLGMADSIERAAHDMALVAPELILYACTSGSFIIGLGREHEIAERIAAHTGVPSVTTSTAVISALRAVNAKRVFMVTPYPDDINLHEVEFFNHYGIEVPAWDAFRCEDSAGNRAIPSERVRDMILDHAADVAAADAVFISCTNLLSLDQIVGLEQRLGKPVVSSNQSSLWAALQAMKIDTSGIAAGSLFACKCDIDVARPA